MKKQFATLAALILLAAAAFAGQPAEHPPQPTLTVTTVAGPSNPARDRITALVRQMNRPRVLPSGVHCDSVELRDIDVQVSGSSAIERHVAYIRGSWNGEPFAGTVRSTSTWEFRQGDWRMVNSSVQPAN